MALPQANGRNRFVVFCASFVLPMIYYRMLVALFYTEGYGPIRSLVGLSVHHFHYGVVLLTVSSLLFIFHRRTAWAVVLAGIGLGLILDSFIPSLLLETDRSAELMAYSEGLAGTIGLFVLVLLAAWGLWIRARTIASSPR